MPCGCNDIFKNFTHVHDIALRHAEIENHKNIYVVFYKNTHYDYILIEYANQPILYSTAWHEYESQLIKMNKTQLLNEWQNIKQIPEQNKRQYFIDLYNNIKNKQK